MVEAISSTNLSSQYINNQQNTVANNYAAINQNNLERTPAHDCVTISSKNNKKKTLLGIGLGLVTIIGAIAGYRKLSTKSLSKIEKHFEKLYNDIPNSQKRLQKIFMRNDITEEETLSILKKYEEIEKAGLNQSKEDYFKAVFEQAKECFGLGKSGTEIKFKNLTKEEAGGIWLAKENTIILDPKYCSKKFGYGAIHHELRHAKQEELYEMLACKEKITEQLKNNFSKDSKGFKTVDEYIDFHWTQEFQNKFLEENKYLFRNNFPLLKDYQFDKTDQMKKLVAAKKEYSQGSKELHLQTEWDARFAEDESKKLVGYSVSHLRRIAEKLGFIKI